MTSTTHPAPLLTPAEVLQREMIRAEVASLLQFAEAHEADARCSEANASALRREAMRLSYLHRFLLVGYANEEERAAGEAAYLIATGEADGEAL